MDFAKKLAFLGDLAGTVAREETPEALVFFFGPSPWPGDRDHIFKTPLTVRPPARVAELGPRLPVIFSAPPWGSPAHLETPLLKSGPPHALGLSVDRIEVSAAEDGPHALSVTHYCE